MAVNPIRLTFRGGVFGGKAANRKKLETFCEKGAAQEQSLAFEAKLRKQTSVCSCDVSPRRLYK
ncbi:MAG: hypothetical protein LUG66_06210 [Clostridiales bacterium]|nr:hypothetical protein [Clostridiales bacterium]